MRNARFEDLGVLSKGGMSTVHRVRHIALRRELAMKVLNPELSANPAEVERFVEEAQVTAQLAHPNVLPVHELGTDSHGNHFFTMEHVQGRTWEQLLAEDGPALDQAALFRHLQILLKVCDVVAFAHSRGVVHCDLKPDNVMVGQHGQVYVMDWGIARLPIERGIADQPGVVSVARKQKRVEEKGRVFGTLGYMAPEQARSRLDQIDERTDVFGLGAILYRVVVGQPIYATGMVNEALARAMFAEITPPEVAAPGRSLPKRLCAIALRAMKVKREDRYPSVDELRRELEAWLRGDGRHPTRTLKAGAVVIREGEPGDSAFIIRRGRCVVWKNLNGRRQELSTLGPGDIFGEAAIFAARPRTATVETLEDTQLVEVSRESLEEELGRTFVMADLVPVLARRFHELDARASTLAEQAQDWELERAVLRHLAVHGAGAADGVRVAPWAPLRDALISAGMVASGRVEDVVASLPGVQVEGDEVRLAAEER